MTKTLGQLRSVLAARAVPYTRANSRSAIDKQPLAGEVRVSTLGLDGDEQGDARVHGGPDKAIHCYPWAHYAGWRDELPGATAAARLGQPGAFGENFSLEPGLDEHGVCIGDEWAIGDALFEVSQGRQPCWKLNDRFAVPDMARRVQRSLRAGWYLRVSRPGVVKAGDAIELVARPHPDWTIARLLRVIDDRDCDPQTLRNLLTLPLTVSWEKLFRRRLENGCAESWQARMDGR